MIEKKKLKLILSLAGLCLVWGAIGLKLFFGIELFILTLLGLGGVGCIILHWVL